jgi:hypothetical protein
MSWRTRTSIILYQQQKRSWTRDRTSITILKAYFGGKYVTELTPALIERYRTWCKETISRRGRLVTPATVNRELACLKRMFNVARQGLIVLKRGIPAENPVAAVSLERENNTRDRVLSWVEFDRLVAVAPTHLKPILLTAYYTGMAPWGTAEADLGPDRPEGGGNSAPLGGHQDAGRARYSLDKRVDSNVTTVYNLPCRGWSAGSLRIHLWRQTHRLHPVSP